MALCAAREWMRHGSVVEMNRESFPVLSVSLDEIWLCVLPVTFNERGYVEICGGGGGGATSMQIFLVPLVSLKVLFLVLLF
jgi:hypothetical protein